MQEENLRSLRNHGALAAKESLRVFSKTLVSVAVAGALAAASASAMAAVADFVFDTQAVGNATPEDPVATLHLADVAGGVQFTLTPNAANSHFTSNTFIQKLWLAYNGPTLTGGNINETASPPQTAGSFTWTAGNPIDSFGFDATANGHTEASYKPLRVDIEFPTPNPQGNQLLRFLTTETSSWSIAGATVADFATAFASTNSQQPSPVHGVLSFSGLTGGSSNWVDSPAAVPEPGTWAMLLAGVIGVAGMVRRRIST
jgi:PEP-CTERM motif